MPRLVRIAAVLSGIIVSACARETSIDEEWGACGDVHNAKVCTWSRTSGDRLLEVGATVPIASIENAPAEVHSMDWPPVPLAALDIPESAQKKGGLTHLTVYWEAMGHPPGPYMTPHFDFHFYTESQANRAAIDCKDRSKPTAMPAGYMMVDVPLPPDMAKMMKVDTLIGLCVPTMGMHSLLASEMESKDTFRGSMVIGHYAGKPVFIEPMLTKAMLMEKKSFDLPIPEVAGLGEERPTKFRAEFDAAKQEYRFTFSGFPATN